MPNKDSAGAEVQAPAPTSANTVPEIKAYLDSKGIDYSGVTLKADLLALIRGGESNA